MADDSQHIILDIRIKGGIVLHDYFQDYILKNIKKDKPDLFSRYTKLKLSEGNTKQRDKKGREFLNELLGRRGQSLIISYRFVFFNDMVWDSKENTYSREFYFEIPFLKDNDGVELHTLVGSRIAITENLNDISGDEKVDYIIDYMPVQFEFISDQDDDIEPITVCRFPLLFTKNIKLKDDQLLAIANKFGLKWEKSNYEGLGIGGHWANDYFEFHFH